MNTLEKISAFFADIDNNVPEKSPIVGISQEDIISDLLSAFSNKNLALCFAAIFNHGIYLSNLMEMAEGTAAEEEYRRQFVYNQSFEEALCFDILNILFPGKDFHGELPIGYYYTVSPFMRENGFAAIHRIYLNEIFYNE